MAEEMRQHLERRAQANLAAGLPPGDAYQAARRQFGGVDQLKEIARDQRSWLWLEQFSRDFRHALRSLGKSRGFTAIALLTLALGIGANTSMFSLLNALLFHAPPYPAPNGLVRVFRTGATFQAGPHSPANFLDLQARVKSFSHLAAFTKTGTTLAEVGKPAEQLAALEVSGDFFAALGVQPALGRFIAAEDDRAGSPPVVVLSDGLWRQRFAADPGILERSIRLDGADVTVIGVMPAGFDDRLVWGQVSAWRPLAFRDETRRERGGNWLSLIGRLAPGVSPEQALAEASTVAADLAQMYPQSNAQTGVNLVPFVRSMQDGMTRNLSLFAMGLAGCVLLIACVNLANLLFARNAARAREHAVRAALGASRGRLIRQSLTESFALALGGGALGLLVARWGNTALGARLFVGGQPFSLEFDWRVAGFALGLAVLAAAFFGVLPALLSSRTDLNEALKRGTRGATGGGAHRVRHALIVVEVALALVLLSSAGFFLRGLDRFLVRDQGWDTAKLLTASLNLPATRYPDAAAQVAFYERLQTRLAALPGVTGVALSRTLPFYGFGFGQRYVVEGQLVPKAGSEPMRDVNAVSAAYFETLGIALLEGRSFTPADATGPMKTIVGESMARKLWPGESAIGKRIAHPVEKQWQEIIGVVRDVSFASNLGVPSGRFQTYRFLAREPDDEISVALRCAVAPVLLSEAVRRAVAELDPELPVNGLRPAALTVEQNLANVTLTGRLLGGFALLGVLLAAVGIYGVISGFVVQRTGEIGVRMALGAQVGDVLRLVLGQGFRLVVIGIVVGWVGTVAAARVLVAMLPSLPGPDTATAAGVTSALVAVALLACLVPARRAARVNPIAALRAE